MKQTELPLPKSCWLSWLPMYLDSTYLRLLCDSELIVICLLNVNTANRTFRVAMRGKLEEGGVLSED